MERHNGHIKLIVLLLLTIELIGAAGLLIYIQVRPMVVKAITLEAGTDIPDVEEFLIYKNRTGSYLTDMQALDMKEPGVYEIKIKVGKRVQSSSLRIVDTTPPTATAVDRTVLKNDVIDPTLFVNDITDATDVTVSFETEPDTSIPGKQNVTLLLTDSSGNQTTLHTQLTVLDVKNVVTIEAGTAMDITADDFILNNEYDVSFITDVSSLDISKPGIHSILLNVNGIEVSDTIEVVDTTPPQADFTGGWVWKDEIPEASAFVMNISDASGVSVDFKTPPDTSKEGNQTVTIVLTDDYGNTTEQEVKLDVVADRTPPQIIGTRDKTVYIGDGVAYRKGVSVTDNKDQDLDFTVDSSGVNLKKAGVYQVIYTAVDKAGNVAKVTRTVTVIKLTVTEDMVYEQADKILAKILTDDMTKLEKAEAIYHWIKSNVGYTGDSDKTDWLAEAYRAMTDKEGDCFTYYAVAQALLTRAGIDNMQVTRLGGKTKHFWNLVNCGDGWYHFDSCPHKDHVETFMLTDDELDAFAKTRGKYYYNRDKSLYPATPKE